jgi:cell division protein FtsQ
LIAATTAVFWVGSWFVMSGAKDVVSRKIENAYLGTTAGWGFAVQNIMVDGRIETDVDTLKAMVAVDKGDPILGVSPSDIQVRLEKLSWVKKAHVERRLPDSLYVKIEERKPVALWQKQKKLVLIDGDGVVLTDQNLARWKNLMIVVGDDAPLKAAELISMLQAEPSIEERVDAATLISGRRWDLKLKSGADVKLPEDELGLALRRLAMNHEEDSILDRDVLTIDVREEGRITLRAKPGAAQDFNTNLNAHITPAAGKPI